MNISFKLIDIVSVEADAVALFVNSDSLQNPENEIQQLIFEAAKEKKFKG